MYRYNVQMLSFILSILFFSVSIAHIFVKTMCKRTGSIWIYVLHSLGWLVSIIYYGCLFSNSCNFSGHEWSPVSKVLQYISFGSWMLFTLFEDLWSHIDGNNKLMKIKNRVKQWKNSITSS